MRTKKEIDYIIGFCEILGDDFPIKFLNKFSNSSQKELDLLKQTILQTPKNKIVVIMGTDGTITLIGGTKTCSIKFNRLVG